jgi:hypothetical protein
VVEQNEENDSGERQWMVKHERERERKRGRERERERIRLGENDE